MKAKYYLLNAGLIILLILTYTFYNNTDPKVKNTKSEISPEEKILELKDQISVNNDPITSSITIESKTETVPKELVYVMFNKSLNQYYQGILYNKGAIYNEESKSFEIKYKGNLISTDKTISKNKYPYIYFEQIKYINNQTELDALKAEGPIEWSISFANNTYKGTLKIVNSNETSVTYGGYLKME